MYEFAYDVNYLGEIFLDTPIQTQMELARWELFHSLDGVDIYEENLPSYIQIFDTDDLGYATRYYLEVEDIFNDGLYSGIYLIDLIPENC